MKRYFLFFISALILNACARVGSPNGGPKDITAPIFLKSNIDTTRVNVPTNLRELRLYFDEYITLKDISKNLIISPPIKIKKIIPSNLSTKHILIQWDEDLDENTTYNFNFGNAIADNNEGNVLPYFNFAFSTGNELDNLYISGTISDAMLPTNRTFKTPIIVGLYKENSDLKQKPDYITQADEDGYFELNYLSEGQYTLIAFEDKDQNSIYNAGKEKVGFLPEKIDLTQNISGLGLKIYPSQKNIKYLETKNIEGGLLMLFEGNPEKIEVKSISEELTQYKVSHQPHSDSVKIWVDPKNSIKNGLSTPIKLSYNTQEKHDTINTFIKINEKEELKIANSKGNILAPKKNFLISANMEISHINPNQWELKSDSIGQDFEAKISETNPSEISISTDFKAGKHYTLSVPKESVSSHFYTLEKSYVFNFEIDKPENYGSLVLRLSKKPEAHFWVQLINNEGNVKHQKYTNEQEIRFTELSPSTYHARILVDSNHNKVWDNTDFSSQKLPEPVYIFPKEIQVRKLWEIVEDWVLE